MWYEIELYEPRALKPNSTINGHALIQEIW